MKSVDIQLIRNATLKLNYSGKTILVDPMFSKKQTFMSFVVPDQNLNPTLDLPMSTSDIINGVDTLLVTHLHPDHFDPAAIEVLDKSLPTFVQPFDMDGIRQSGFTNVITVDDVIEMDGITITRTTGHHGPQEILEHLGEVSGFVLQADNYPTVYIVGDCIWEEEIKTTLETFKPDIVITNSGGAKFMGEHQILMNDTDTVDVAKYASQAKVIAVHMESLDHCQTTRESLAHKAQEAGVNLLIPVDGETISI